MYILGKIKIVRRVFLKNYNKLINETSPYLLQHAENPVDWYAWGEEAFKKAKAEDKPIFLSIGYSTCHWCHVMAHESFENQQTADILNRDFISIKVDKEERPDIDSIYMNVCQAVTGSGGWPTSIFMTPEQKPFFAGTYFPPISKYGLMGFNDLLSLISDNWRGNRHKLISSSDEIVNHISDITNYSGEVSETMISDAVLYFEKIYDKKCGGFGSAPKFPTPHNLLFLLNIYEKNQDTTILEMAENTLIQMYRGGIFDHIGYGFSRYSTDNIFLAPHFEKMLYDNALLMLAYTKAFSITKKMLYKDIAEKTAEYIIREMTNEQGGFYSAQDADSDGVEGKYYVFEKDEIIKLLGEEKGGEFCSRFDITEKGNFENKNIPNLLKVNVSEVEDTAFDEFLTLIYEYRKSRNKLHLDDKILTSWNSLMISAFSYMYRTFNNIKYLNVAENAYKFIDKNLTENNNTLFVSYRNGNKSGKGFIDDYAFYIFALINLYEATLDKNYIDKAFALTQKAIDSFYDVDNGGFYLYGSENEQLIVKPKEVYDSAIPSGNSVMCYNLLKLTAMNNDEKLLEISEQQMGFMAGHAEQYPGGFCFYLLSVITHMYPLKKIVCVLSDKSDIELIKAEKRDNINLIIFESPTEEYALQDGKTTFYVCDNHTCYPPTNSIKEAFA
ncbi:MAG TPA: thioredoxin domain-containing protein [Clostridiales bacterium]|nr:thioredoxin domain-containing protein [Clostridiales bacterium]